MSRLVIVVLLLSVLVGANALAIRPADDHNLEWAKLIKCNKFLIEFKQSVAAYRQCLLGFARSFKKGEHQQFWAKVPSATDACKAIAKLDFFDVEMVDQDDDRGPLWLIRPTGNDAGSFTMVTVGMMDRRDERELRKSFSQMQAHHGFGVTFVFAETDRYNLSSVGKFHQVTLGPVMCFDIEHQSPGAPLLEQPTPDTPPVDLLWSDGSVLTIPYFDGPGFFSYRHRGCLVFDGKQIDEFEICQISIRSQRFLNATNGVLWIPDLPLGTKGICPLPLSYALWWLEERPFVPIRSAYYSTANNKTYFNEFYINVDNPKCVEKYLANRADVGGKCEPQIAEKGRVKNDLFEIESEIHMIEG